MKGDVCHIPAVVYNIGMHMRLIVVIINLEKVKFGMAGEFIFSDAFLCILENVLEIGNMT